MIFYSDISDAKSDIAWLTQICTLSHFSTSRLSKNDLSVIEKKLTDTNNEAIVSFFNYLFEEIDLKRPNWVTKLIPVALPAIALIPGQGMRVVLEHEVDGKWKVENGDGIAMMDDFPNGTVFTDIKIKQKDKSKISSTEMFRAIALQQKPMLISAIIASVGINILALATSFFSMQVYDRVIPLGSTATLFALAFGVFVAIFLEMLLKLARSHFIDYASKEMDIAYSHNIFTRFLKIRLDALPKSIGSLSGRLQSYATVRSFISSVAIYVLIDFPFALLFFAVIVALGGWMMGMVVLAFFIISIFVGIVYKNKIEVLSKTSTMASHKKLGLLVESVENIENLKASGANWSLLSRWNALTEDAIYDDIEIRYYSELSSYIAAFLQQFAYVLLVALGAYLVSTEGTMTMGGLIATTILSGRVFSPIARLPALLVQWGRTKISIEDLDHIYSLDRDNEGVERPLYPLVYNASIEARDVVFAYGQNVPAVKLQKLHIATGERVAILGKIGSGKSTLLKLFSGLYRPQNGNIFFNGIDIHHIARSWLNETIGYVPQNYKLISGTLRDNLLMGMVGIDDEQVINVAKETGLIHFINTLPKGLDTPVPEGGESVSGGQRQMIVLTRLLLLRPKIWLLDEPTANMDDVTERQVLESIDKQVKESSATLIIVTHNPLLLSLVDRIIIVTPGGIVLDGEKNAVLAQLRAPAKNNKAAS